MNKVFPVRNPQWFESASIRSSTHFTQHFQHIGILFAFLFDFRFLFALFCAKGHPTGRNPNHRYIYQRYTVLQQQQHADPAILNSLHGSMSRCDTSIHFFVDRVPDLHGVLDCSLVEICRRTPISSLFSHPAYPILGVSLVFTFPNLTSCCVHQVQNNDTWGSRVLKHVLCSRYVVRTSFINNSWHSGTFMNQILPPQER